MGLAVSRVFGIPTLDEFWGHLNFTDIPQCSASEDGGLEELTRGITLGNTAWVPGQVYRFKFEFKHILINNV